MERQGQSFRLLLPCGQSTGGLKTPGYSKTVLRTESAAAAPHPFQYLRFQWRGQLRMSASFISQHAAVRSCALFCSNYGNQAPSATCIPSPPRINFCPPMQPFRVNSNVEFAHAMGRQGQSFRLLLPCGQSTGGLKTPGYSKTVLRTESAAAYADPFKYHRFQWRRQLQMTTHTVSQHAAMRSCALSCSSYGNQAHAVTCMRCPHPA